LTLSRGQGTKRATTAFARLGNPRRDSRSAGAFLAYPRSSAPLEVNVSLTNLKLLLGFLILIAPTVAQAKCMGTVHDLRANHVKTKWQETTENDGKPLTISITDGAHGLIFHARKAGALWLTGNVSICRTGGATEITLKNTRATSNVPMMARLALPSTQSARIVNNRIRLGGAGWSGTFMGA
jgi:hypothetical protein